MQFLFTKTPLAYLAASFWRDEAFSYLMAKQPIVQMLWTTAKDANPPLYYLLLKIWMFFCGQSEIAIRTLSLLFFWGTLYAVFLILHDVFKINTRKSAIYLLLFILNPLLHYYAFEARMYSLMTFLATISFYFLFKKQYKAYAIVALLSIYTHYFLGSVIALQIVISLFFLTKKEKDSFLSHIKKYLVWIAPWIILLLFAHPPFGHTFWIGTLSFRDILLFPGVLFTGYESTAGFPYRPLIYVSAIVFIIVGYGIGSFLTQLRKKTVSKEKVYRSLMLLGWGIGIPLAVFLFSFLKPIFLPRYLIFATVGLLLFIVLIIDAMHVRMKYMVCVVLLLTSVHYAGVQAILRTKAPVKKTFTEIKKLLQPNDVVYVLHEYDFHIAEYYINDSQVFIYRKTYDELPWFIGKVLIPKEKVTSSLPQYPRRAFIVQPNGSSYAIQSIY